MVGNKYRHSELSFLSSVEFSTRRFRLRVGRLLDSCQAQLRPRRFAGSEHHFSRCPALGVNAGFRRLTKLPAVLYFKSTRRATLLINNLAFDFSLGIIENIGNIQPGIPCPRH
jgi:hypothetical protein